MIHALSFLITYEKNFLTEYQGEFGFYKRSIVSVREMLVKSDFISKLAIVRQGSSSSTSITNENKCFIVYSLVVIGFSNLSRNFGNL